HWFLVGPVALVAGALLTGGIGPASGDPAPIVFSGEATASGVRVTVTAKDAPVTSTPFDAGAPTAYAQLDTIGGSNGYAAFPFPGTVFQSGPGLAVGLLNQSGLPVPSPPGFPNYVASDSTTPSAESGSGPYHLKTTSSPTKADALAAGGIRSDGQGNAGLATATATVESLGASAGALATAVSTAEALTMGPLTIGQVRSTVTVKLTPDGTVTPKTALAVSGVRIAGVPVSVTQDGLAAGGATVPLTADPALVAALKQAGITVEVVAARQIDKGAVAPAVQIVTPVPTPGLGDGTGHMTLTLGGASAAFSSFVPLPPIGDTTIPAFGGRGGGSEPATSATSPAGDDTGGASTVPSSSGSTGGGTTSSRPSLDTTAPTDAASLAPPAEVALRPGVPAVGSRVLSTRELGEQFDIRDLYLAAVILGLAVLGMATLLRLLGVRSA
ncbi:MAG TPA: hypothetical protein VGP90_15015, partial [Acidimicrobiia bacterium]|nr:hypothetical protein [Acidimicrobiia bacterium]